MKWIVRRLAVLAAALFMANAALADTTEINFGIISTESTQNLKQYWTPFLADLEKQTGIKVNPFFASDYAGIIEGMRFGKVQVAWYGNKSAMEAVDRADAEVFAQSVDAEGSPGYWSLLVTNVDNAGINTVDDVLKCDKALSFGNGDPNSTSGFLVPSVFVFGERNVDPKDCYKAVTNANHETNLMAVVNKQVDFATNNTENPAQFRQVASRRSQEDQGNLALAADPVRSDRLAQGSRPAAKDKILVLLHDLWPTGHAAGSEGGARQSQEAQLGAVQALVQCPALSDPHPRDHQVDQQDQGVMNRWPPPTRRPRSKSSKTRRPSSRS